ncbi:MAG: Zn-dependent alcohol dehydrogenase [Anaerolineales bacterium]|nr:Zn-dependent alcohol dehydrogenase [Anaerolineales bacterium]
MKAAVCYNFGRPLVVEEVTLEPPQQDEVEVQIAACAICHSDLHWLRGDWGGETPLVAGHEAAGVVSTVGPGVNGLQSGDHVVVYLRRSCGRCFFCTRAQPYLCEAQFRLDRESPLRNAGGVRLVQGLRTAAFAERVLIHKSQAIKIPTDLPLDRACLLACGVVTGLGAVTNTARVEPGSSVAVLGVGGVGLNSVQGARLVGAEPIIAIDRLDSKLEIARRFGATHVINAVREDAVAAVLALTEGRGVDYAFAAVGSAEAIVQAGRMTRRGGATVVVGMPANREAEVMVNTHHLTEGRRLIGSLMGSTQPAVDIPRLVETYRQGHLLLDELISQRYALEDINVALDSLERGAALRNVIVF